MYSIKIPDKLPLLYLNDVCLPGQVLSLPISNPKNILMIQKHFMNPKDTNQQNKIIGVLPVIKDLPDSTSSIDAKSDNIIGTAASVQQVYGTMFPQPKLVITICGVARIQIKRNSIVNSPFNIANVSPIEEIANEDIKTQLNELRQTLEEKFMQVDPIALYKFLQNTMRATINATPPSMLLDLCAAIVFKTLDEKYDFLCTIDLSERLSKIKKKIFSLTADNPSFYIFKDNQTAIVPKNTLFGNSRIRNIRRRDFLPVTDGESDEFSYLEEKIKNANLPPHALKTATKDLQKLKRLNAISSEQAMLHSYLDLLVDLPWSISSKEIIDINKARKDLEIDHYGMVKLKKRVLEYLAVRQLKNNLRGPILCFVGPPGVGKTSIGKSIALTLGREFQRISLGGICNQSDIRGHRRTYVGAMPGRILNALKMAKTNNPVILFDEIDKMTISNHGDPSAALLEVLDPEQNYHFVDHYLNIPFDLSQVLFIATANKTNTISPPLLDRMEVIKVPGYSLEDKVAIVRKHLIPKQLYQHGLSSQHLNITDEAIGLLISCYTQEAGVRNLERKLAEICRHIALEVAEKVSEHESIEATHRLRINSIINGKDLIKILGEPLFEISSEIAGRVGVVGVAVGLAWIESGGCLTIVETKKIPEGNGKLILTGHLGEVMKESANLALNWIRSVAHKYQLVESNGDLMCDKDVHIHFPSGSISKDGPSAGITIATALFSLFSGIPVSPDVAMTGEITLRGIVLPVGEVKAKILAAYRSGFTRVIIPKNSEKELNDLPKNVKDKMKFIGATTMDDVLEAAFDGELINYRTDTLSSKL